MPIPLGEAGRRPAGPRTGEGGPDQPTSFVHGRYAVKRFLGEGGKKRVYLAHDEQLDRDVAFALLKSDGLDAEGLVRIRREAQAMGRLGDHPHIVTVFDIGEENGQPYIVSQYMAGGSLQALLAEADHRRLDWEPALRVADQISQALEHAHSHGVIHRDLKPGNVFLSATPSPVLGASPRSALGGASPAEGRGARRTPSPLAGEGWGEGASAPIATAKLGDFGLAMALDRSRLTQAGMMVGTVSYMAPEQALGGEVTPKSDLYSLGALLYELVTGRPPFMGDESVAIISQHLNTPPVAPTWHNPEVPPGLEVLILSLLEKDPAKRPGSAAEVRQVLAGVAAPTPTPPLGLGEGSSSTAPLYRRVFVGREAELRQAQQGFDRALSGLGSLIMVVGEPGIGKTALCEQLATYVAVRGGKTLVGHCYEEGSLSLPYLAFVEALRSYVLGREPVQLKDELGTGAAEVARIVSEIRDRVPVELRPAGDPDDDRWRLFQAVAGFLRNAAGVQPIALVLEDLHWADRGTLDLLLHMARNLEHARLLIIGTYRDVEVDRAHPLSGTLAELRRVGEFGRIPLRGLTVDEVHRMMNVLRGQEVPWSRAEAIHRQTEGNPLFVQEVLRYLVEEGLVVREGGRYALTEAGAEAGVPEGLWDVVGKRLSRLSEKANQILSVAAVIGREFRLDVLQRVAGLSEDEIDAALQEATERAIVEERAGLGVLAFRFTHAFFRQTLYEEIFASRRLRLHQQVARGLEALYAGDGSQVPGARGRRLTPGAGYPTPSQARAAGRIEDHASELAEHFSHSTAPADLGKALDYSALAARRAMSVFAYGEAARHLEMALKIQDVLDPDDQRKRCDLLLALGEALMPAGEPQRVFDDVGEQALALAEALGDGTRAARISQLAIEALERWRGATAPRLPAFQRWVERLDRHATPGTRARLEVDKHLTALHLRAGRWAEGRLLEARALATARELGDAEALFSVFQEVMTGEAAVRSWPEIVRLARDAADQPRQGISRHRLAIFLLNGPEILLAAGERERVEALWHEQEQLAAKSQDAELQLTARVNHFYRALLDGDLEGAVAITEDWLRLGQELGSPDRAIGGARLYGFWPLLWLGRFEALAALDALAASRTEGAPSANSRAQEGLVLACQGANADARARLQQSLQGLEISNDGPAKTIALLLETAVLVRDREAAAQLASALGDLPAITRPVHAVARHLGGTAHLLGDRAAARVHYHRALDWATQIRFRPEIALTRLGLAQLLLDEAQDNASIEQRAEGLGHLDFAIKEFEAMKMQPALERALALKGSDR